jgi:hypothetical protein
MAKATEHEKILRVHEVYKMLVGCWSTADILEYAGNKWGLEKSQAYNYIAEAREKLKTNCAINESEWIAQKMATLEQMARDELSPNEETGTVGTNSRLAALQFIRTQAQFIKVI